MRRALLTVGGASATQVALLAALGLGVAYVLSAEEFGIVRLATAVLMIATMLGHAALHDAAASFIARSESKTQHAEYVGTATALALASSAIVTLTVSVVLLTTDLWTGQSRTTLLIVMPTIVVTSISLVWTSALRGLGRMREYALLLAVGGAVQLAAILPLSWTAALRGWEMGRWLAVLLMLYASWLALRKNIAGLAVSRTTARHLVTFSAPQLVSGAMSMTLMGVDTLAIEWLTGSLEEVAVYGLASLFARAGIAVPTALAQVYFAKIGKFTAGGIVRRSATRNLMTVSIGAAALVGAISAVGGTVAIDLWYGSKYAGSKEILYILSGGVVVWGAWSSLAVVNTALGRTVDAVAISGVGLSCAVLLLWALVPAHGGVGAAWAMNAAALFGVIVGVALLLIRDRFSGTLTEGNMG